MDLYIFIGAATALVNFTPSFLSERREGSHIPWFKQDGRMNHAVCS